MAWVIFHKFLERQFDGNAVNLDGAGDPRVMLVTSARAPVQATDEFMTTIDDTEVSGSNYTALGFVLPNESIVLNAGVVTFDSDNPTWTQHATGFATARYAILYNNTGAPGTSRVVCYADLGGDKGNVSGDLIVNLDGAGIFTVAAA